MTLGGSEVDADEPGTFNVLYSVCILSPVTPSRTSALFVRVPLCVTQLSADMLRHKPYAFSSEAPGKSLRTLLSLDIVKSNLHLP